jgi:L-threonylcarbamoyladenylate synthase
LHEKHYSPLTPLLLVDGFSLPERGRGAYLWLNQPQSADFTHQMPADAPGYAAALYEILHSLDDRGFDWIAVEQPPEWPEWAGILDRLRRASY